MFLLFTYVFSFFLTNFSIKIHSPKRSTDYGTSLSQVTSEATSPSYPHFTSAPRNTFLERTKNKLHKKLFPWNSPASQRTLCRRIHAFSHFLQVHEVHEVQSIAPPGHPDTNTNHKSIHINSQRIHSGTFHLFHSLKKIVWCFVFQLSHFQNFQNSVFQFWDPDMASGILAKRTRNVGYHSVSPGHTSKD